MARPFLKWVGGKRQLVTEITSRFRDRRMSTYWEPFLGGGAIFWALEAQGRLQRAVLNDWNKELIDCYRALRGFPDELIDQLQKLKVDKAIFEELRQAHPSQFSPCRRAARFIYLNKTCFTPGSQVLLSNETWRSIEEVTRGDRLWNGRVVSEVLSRAYFGNIRRIRVQGSPWVMSVTEDHPILSVKGKGNAKSEKRTPDKLLQEVNLRSALELKPGDYVFLPTIGSQSNLVDWHRFWPEDNLFGPQTNKQRLTRNPRDVDMARLLGYYAAEGHIAYQANHKDGSRGRIKSAVWTFNSDERDTYVADLEDICRRLFRIHPTITHGPGNKYSVEVHSAQIAAFIRTLVPGQSWAKRAQERKTKRLHTALMTLPPIVQQELLKAWLRGDSGLKHKKSGNTSELTGTCTVLPMARQMYRLAQRCGLKPSWRISHPKGRTHHQDGSPVDNTTAHVSFSGDDVKTLGFEILPRKRRAYGQRRFVGRYLCVRIKAIQDLPYDGSVHNIEVDGDHLICVDGVVSHNCFNGLYRVNKQGMFNAPWGKYENPTLYDELLLRECSKILNDVAILRSEDFAEVLKDAKAGDSVYIDPPYIPLNPTSNFTSYTAEGFGQRDQERLAAAFRELVEKGCQVIASNSDTELTRGLYDGFDMIEVQAARSINSKGDGRGKITELLIVGG